MTSLLHALLLVAAALGSAHAWLRGNDGRAQWDYECHFEGLELVSLEAEPSSRCADLCLAQTGCSHWTWTPESDGTCQLKQGATNVVQLHAVHLCGFLPARFAPDDAQAFDLGLSLAEDGDAHDGITDEEAETALRLLNSFRSKRGMTKLTLDARLILLAKEMATTCREVPFTENMNPGDGYELFPASVPSRGFAGQVHAVSVAAPHDSSVRHAIEWWTSGVDPETRSKPFFSDEMAVVGFAKGDASSCHDGGDSSATGAIVWTMLLAQTE
ncbi:SCP-like extracellular protein [Phytophthora cinnamomi]|uniref:SCP-like extracellular protein n=1 Tax=Phytophthora cinnamomi TaxID=4785 RepID=UPI003559AD7E|nr:SCP-like extracellular protein [Phytophthora cinnamomi]